ncbi:MAG TPA: tRNA pseudouridine(55) synthase TruB [Terriglobales bacterium]|nr:tRNA pseudouridine(55) synthase TruB [Terriglobales bacterium]
MNAILVIDKPAGITSHDVVARVRRILGERSVGHLGTLDPMATGVLPLLIGHYTRLAQFFEASTKSYEGTIRLGFVTDTYDAEGQPLGPAQEVQVTLDEIQQAARQFVGRIEQVPPNFSAKKIGGVPAYKLARKSREVSLKSIQVTIEELALSDLRNDLIDFTAKVSAGTYVRSLAHDLGQKLRVGAHLARLRRTASGEFTLEEAVTLQQLQSLSDQNGGSEDGLEAELAKVFVNPRSVLQTMPSLTVTDETAGQIANGRAVNLPEFSPAHQVKVFLGSKRLIAIATRIAGTLFQPKVVLNATQSAPIRNVR